MFFIVERKTLSCVCLWTPPLPCLRKTTPVAYKQEHIPECITKKYDLRVVFSCVFQIFVVPSARPFPSGAGSLRRYVRVLRDVCKSRIFLHAAPSSLPIIACLRVCGIACAIRMVSKASYNRGVLLRSAKKSAQKLAYMQFL